VNWAGLSAMERAERIRAARPVIESIVGQCGAEASAWHQAAKAAGVPYDALRRALDTEYRKMRVASSRRSAISSGHMHAIIHRKQLGDAPREKGPDEATVARLRAAIPPDTRSLTARMLGDPIPGRSALDRRRPKLFAGAV